MRRIRWCKKVDFRFHESTMISLAVLLNRHIHHSEALKIEILLATSRSFFFKDYNGIFKTHFEGKANFSTIDASHIISTDDISPDIDMIITDSQHSLNTPHVEVILIHQSMTDKDIQNISQAIDRIKQRKKDQLLSEKRPSYQIL